MNIVTFLDDNFRKIETVSGIETVQINPFEWECRIVTGDEQSIPIVTFNREKHSNKFAELLQHIYRCGKNSNIQETEPEAYGFTKFDVMERANILLIHLTHDEAKTVLETVGRKADVSAGIDWSTLDFFIEKYIMDSNREKFPSYSQHELEKIELQSLTSSFFILPKKDVPYQHKECYALDLRDGSQFLIDPTTTHEQFELLSNSGDFAFGTEL